MVARNVCRNCRILVKGQTCPLCGGNDLTTTWAGVAIIYDPRDSQIAKEMGIEAKGSFALRVR
jgi:RNA polymerase subunit RPABC4/transcription elongation factor Spt4